MSSITYGNGITGTISYDNQYRLTTHPDRNMSMNLSYGSYDPNGNITSITMLDATRTSLYL